MRAATGLEDVRMLGLRHRFASSALALGETLLMFGKPLKNSDIEMTARYAHLAYDSIRETAERIAGSIAVEILQNSATVTLPTRTTDRGTIGMENLELLDLVDAPRERLDVEYKTWLDLKDRGVQAELAKHLCALANHGSGYVVFGISNDGTSTAEPPQRSGPYDQDSLSGIVKRYLTPTFQVEVYEVKSTRTGITHPVIWVPSHREVPVCSKRAGPHDSGKPVGIEQVTHYTREPGPASVPATTPEHWRPIIRRCVRQDRRALLDAIEPLLRLPEKPIPEPGEVLQLWHDAAHEKFLAIADGDPAAGLLKRAHYQLSYRISVAGGEKLDMGGLVHELRTVCNEVRQSINSGLPMFEIAHEREFMPRSTTDVRVGEDEFLEAGSGGTGGPHLLLWDFWRVSRAGMATVIRAYREDHSDDLSSSVGLHSGEWFWLRGMAGEIAELICHARAFSGRFEAPETLSIRAEWRGLKGKKLGEPGNPLASMRSGIAHDDRRVFTKTVPVAGLAEGWRALAAEMLSPVRRLFDPTGAVSEQHVREWMKNEFTR